MIDTDDYDVRRPLGLNLLAGLYLFFFLVSASTFGNPFPFLGNIYLGLTAKTLVFIDSLFCLYLFMGIMKRQALTWYLLLGYNLFQIVNTIVNLKFITREELEKIVESRVHQDSLLVNNVAAALAILLLSQFIYRHKHYFNSKGNIFFDRCIVRIPVPEALTLHRTALTAVILCLHVHFIVCYHVRHSKFIFIRSFLMKGERRIEEH